MKGRRVVSNESTSAARSAILNRIREAQQTGILPDVRQDLPEKAAYPAAQEDEILSRFVKELEILGVQYFIESDAGDVKERIKSLIGGSSVFSWDEDQLPYDAGSILEGGNVCFGHDDRSAWAQAEIGLTGCDAAIAETGSLVVIPGDGRPRAASLLPFVHIAIVERSRIYFGMGQFFESEAARISESSYINVITGPSRTADIELQLTLGVHGPGRVIVVIGP